MMGVKYKPTSSMGSGPGKTYNLAAFNTLRALYTYTHIHKRTYTHIYRISQLELFMWQFVCFKWQGLDPRRQRLQNASVGVTESYT